jgi:hypothetical protein
MRRLSVTSKSISAVIVCGILLGACGDATTSGGSTAQETALRIPLATAGTGSATGPAPSTGAIWALVPMGDPGEPENTFWQVFVLTRPKPSWSLVTPKGVADNGGLVASFGSGAAVVGVEASQLLGFSPVAVTADGGLQWSPAVLPAALAPVPDALAATPAGRLLALLGRTGSSIVASDNDAVSAPAPISSLTSVAASSAGSCTLTALTAITFGPVSQPVVGGLCEGSGQVGIFELTGKDWRLVGPAAPSAALNLDTAHGSADGRSLDTEVLRLATQGAGLTALAEVVSAGGTASLFRLNGSSSDGWRVSPVFDVPPTQHLVATGNEPGGSAFVLLSRAGAVTAEVLPASGLAWKQLPVLPPGTATLAFGPDGVIYALAANHSVMTVYKLGPKPTWAPVQVIIVPIQYGSSS